jgi:transmembrane sensor
MKSRVQSSASVGEAAAEWFLTLRTVEDPPAELVQQWLAWMAASEEHRRAFEQIAQVWQCIAPALIEHHSDDSSADAYDGLTSVAEWREQRSAASSSEAGTPRRWMAPLAAVAASLALVAVWFVSSSGDAVVSAGTFATRGGEHLNLLLADGSQVTLGAQSRLKVDFSPHRRSLQLSAGEAYFHVAKDRSRPFEVRAMNSAITAVGTAFNVRAVEHRVTVTVTEGTVRVADPAAIATAPLQLQHGQQISYRPGGEATRIGSTSIKEVDAAESARWRDGWLVYRDEPLQFVVADVARYTELKFEVTEPAAELQFSGAVFKDRVEEWIAALPEVAPVMVERHGDKIVIGMRRAGLVQLD